MTFFCAFANNFFFLFQDNSFAEVLNNNPHVSLLRHSKKKIPETDTPIEQKIESHTATETVHQETHLEQHQENHQNKKPQKQPYLPTPTRRGEVRRPVKSDDSIKLDPFDLWYVSDESFLEVEKSCESPREIGSTHDASDTTLLYDVQAPSFLIHDSDSDELLDDSVFEHSSIALLSPIKQVAMRRPSTILEESTIRSNNSNEESCSGSSLSLKQSLNVADESSSKSNKSNSYRPSLYNVFPTRSRIGFYDNLDTSSSVIGASIKNKLSGKENSINLMKFDSLDRESPPQNQANGNNSISLMRFDDNTDEESFSNLSVDQTQQHNSSMSDNETPDQFNDTLEAVDYYMKQGKKLLDKTGASTTLLQPSVTASPKNRNNSLLKQTLARRHLMSMTGDNKLANKKLF